MSSPETALGTLKRGDVFRWACSLPDETPETEYLVFGVGLLNAQVSPLGTGMTFAPVNTFGNDELVIKTRDAEEVAAAWAHLNTKEILAEPTTNRSTGGFDAMTSGRPRKRPEEREKTTNCPRCGSDETRPATNYGKVVPGRYVCHSDRSPCRGRSPALFEIPE